MSASWLGALCGLWANSWSAVGTACPGRGLVARNGGIESYEADRAHRATGLRARRRGPVRQRERYVLDRLVWARAWEASSRVNHEWAEIGREGAKLLGSTTPAGVRLNEIGELFEALSRELDRFADAWLASRKGWTTSGAG